MKGTSPATPPESLESLLRRDLEAWIAAKAAIEKARRSPAGTPDETE
ncbi:MAG TPA: hypothetical protein VFU92_01350 [Usitatibacter sp.]|nr:hypothetical protein [Usitatibacter sp.]